MSELVTVAEDPIKRDRWGRPLIVQPDTGELVAYTRASSVGKAIEDTYYLSLWQQRQVLRGVVAEPTLALDAESAGAEPDRGDAAAYKAWKVALDEVVERAHVAAKSQERADLGTYMHTCFEAAALGNPMPEIPKGCERDVPAWQKATAGWRWLALERFVVNDLWQVAGTLDALILREVDDGYVVQVGDWKTGRTLDFAGLGYTAQIAAYADSQMYDPETGERATLLSLAVDAGIDPGKVRLDTTTALLVHVPAGEGRCDIYDVPLEQGRAAVSLAMDVRAMRSASKKWLTLRDRHEIPAPDVVPNTSDPVDQVADRIAAATSIPDLLAVRKEFLQPVDYGNGRVFVPWTDAHEALAAARAAMIKKGVAA